MIIVYYGVGASKQSLAHQGFGFFPRTKARVEEFGLDAKKHTHLFLPVPKSVQMPPEVVVSPDGRWFAFTEVDLQPRIWEISTLGKGLIAEGAIKK